MASESEMSALEKKIIRQVEFYFGDFNLHRDKFMKEEMTKNDGWFSMDVMLKFQRLSSICSEPGTILAALKKSKNNLLEVDIESQSIRRKPNKPVPENNDKFRRELSKRTVYVKGFPQNETIENITDFLEDYGAIEGVHLRRFNNPHAGAAFKGSLFATFAKLEEASKFLDAPMVYYQDKQLEKKTKEAFWKEKEAENAERSNNKRKKQAEKQSKDGSKQDVFDEYSFVQVSNIDDQTITHLHIKSFLQDLGATECKFFGRYEKGGSTGYILFHEENLASEMLQLLKDKNNGSDEGTAIIKEVTLKFEPVTPEQRLLAVECYKDFRGFGRKRKGGNVSSRNGNRQKQQREHIVFDDDGEPVPAKKARLSSAAAEDD